MLLKAVNVIIRPQGRIFDIA